MNYFAHAFHLLDDPYLAAGTAAPDWLSVADRKVRLRPRRVEPFLGNDDAVTAAVAAGVMRHFHDDGWFHRSQAFYEVSGELTRRFRDVLPSGEGYRGSFLGHIVTEILLDAVLAEDHPSRLDDYYAALRSIDPQRVQSAVNAMARTPTERLATFIAIFLQEEFLRDYVDDVRLLHRLNQVTTRVGLKHLPDDLLPVLKSSRDTVRQRLFDLLPPDRHTG